MDWLQPWVFVSLGYALLDAPVPESVRNNIEPATQRASNTVAAFMLMDGCACCCPPTLIFLFWLVAVQDDARGNLIATTDHFGLVAAVTGTGIMLVKTAELVNKAREGFALDTPAPADGFAKKSIAYSKHISKLAFNGCD